MELTKYFLVIVLILLSAASCTSNTAVKDGSNKNPIKEGIRLPDGFQIDIFASDLGSGFNLPGPNKGVRFMEFYKDVLFASLPSSSSVIALVDNDKDGKADEAITVISNLNRPHGIAFHDEHIYVANEDSIIRAKLNEDFTVDASTIEYLVDLPKGGHWTRTIKINNNSLYISIGSSCNLCIENDIRRASIMECDMDSFDCRPFARGIRNAVGFAFNSETNEIYATENSRDNLGDDLPPDEINIVKEGKHYGWPFCYGKNINDPEYNNVDCSKREPSFVDLQAHSAPLGLAFNFGDDFPEEYKGDLFVAYHGSWNRKEKTGYKVVRIEIDTKQVHDFVAGWLTENEDVIGRPVDIIFDKEGIMYVSDDNAGIIYRI